MVIWVFAGGGEAELRGLITFLRNNFPNHFFERKTPSKKKPGPRVGQYSALGFTGTSLRRQMRYALEQALLDGRCDCILVLDDLDCHEYEAGRQAFETVIQEVAGTENTQRIIAFASPEIEAWLIADWSHTFAVHPDLRRYQVQIRRDLASEYQSKTMNGDIHSPENFSQFNEANDVCECKLSEQIMSIVYFHSGINYSKDDHSGTMLASARADVIQQSCPIFRFSLYAPLMTGIENQ